MNDEQVRRMAHDMLDEYARRVDVEGGLDELRHRTATAGQSRRRLAAAAALVAVFGVGAVALVLTRGGDAEQVRTNPDVTDPLPEPSVAAPPIASVPPMSPTAPPTSALPPSDVIAQSGWTSASTEGLWVSRDGTEWNRTAHDQPLTGPALLIDRYVVTQPAIPEGGHDVTAGPITIIADGRSDEWTPPRPELEDGSGISGYELVGVAWLEGRPVFFVRQFERLFPESAYDRLLAVDLRDGTVGDIVEFGGWEARTVAAFGGEGGTIIVFRRAGTTNEVRVLDATGSTLFSHELTADADWSLSSHEDGAVAFGFRHGDAGMQLAVVTVDAGTLSATEQSLDIPTDSTEVLPCDWPSFDGTTLTCARDSGPTSTDIHDGDTTPIGGPRDGVIAQRTPPPGDR